MKDDTVFFCNDMFCSDVFGDRIDAMIFHIIHETLQYMPDFFLHHKVFLNHILYLLLSPGISKTNIL